MPETELQCWICGSPADSGEHIFKARGLRRFFEAQASNKDLPVHFDGRAQRSIQGPKAERLKYPKNLCHGCNTDRTSSFDRAYDQLSDWFMENQADNQLKEINFEAVFGANFVASIDKLLRYCAKALGCRIVASNSELPAYFPNPVTGKFLNELQISICHLERFRWVKRYDSTLFNLNLVKGNLLTNISQSLKEATGRQLVKNAIWWEGIGHFQITYWFAIQPSPELGQILSADSAKYPLHRSNLSDPMLNQFAWNWLAEHPTGRS
jgi:hypothetical protein